MISSDVSAGSPGPSAPVLQNTEGRITLDALPAGTYLVEHCVINSQHANAYANREALEQRLSAAGTMGSPEWIAEVLAGPLAG